MRKFRSLFLSSIRLESVEAASWSNFRGWSSVDSYVSDLDGYFLDKIERMNWI